MAQKLKFGNGTWATKKGSTLAYNDENNNYKPLPFTTTRNSIETRVNKEGLIEVVGDDKPRIDYKDSADGVLLLEPSRTNLISYSEDFSQSYWTKSGSSILSNNAISPDGSLNASKLVENTSNSAHRIFNGSGLSVSGNVSMSVFAKKGGRNFIRLTNNNIVGAFFDLNNGVVLGVSSGITAKIEDFGNDWYRCSITQTGVANERLIVYLSNNGIDTTYQGDGTSGVYICGAMLEEGSYPTSYIPTYGSTVQRAADTASGAGNSEVFNDSEGVLFANILPSTFTDVAPNYYKTITVSDNTTSNRVFVGVTSTSKLSIGLAIGGTNSFFPETPIAEINVKVALKYTTNSITAYLNGFKPQTPISGSFNFASGALKSLNLNDAAGGYPFYGKTKELGYYDTALTDEELEYLTSYRSLNELVTELNLNEL